MLERDKSNKNIKLSEFTKFIPKNSSSKGRIAKGLGMMNLIVYLGLKAKADRKCVVQISYHELAEFVGASRSGAQKSVYELEKAKLIKRLPPEYETAVPTYKILE